MEKTIMALDFHLFDGEGGTGAPTASNEGTEQHPNGAIGNNGPNSQVGSDNSAQGEDPSAEFAALVGKGGKYHDIYGQMVSSAIQERFKNQAELKGQIDKISDDLSPLFMNYGLESGDFEGLKNAIAGDDAFYQVHADAAGMDIDQYKAQLKLQADAERGRRIQEQMEEQQRFNEQVAQWEAESEELKQYFPNFDLGLEIQANEKFADYLDMGISVHDAFWLTHRDEIMSGQNDAVSRQATQKVVTTINQRQSRPAEGAMAGSPPIVKKTVPSELTKEDWDELDRRVTEGEIIAI